MLTYEALAQDPEILSIYDQVHALEQATGGYAHHDMRHIRNVAGNVEALLLLVNQAQSDQNTPSAQRALYSDSRFIEEAKIAALLHDLGAAYGKEGHAQRSYAMAKALLEKRCLALAHRESVLEAIRCHSDGFDQQELMGLSLILADKLDIAAPRVTQAGALISGQRQLLHIQRITASLERGSLQIAFDLDGLADQQELEAFSFMPKVFRGIHSFGAFVGLPVRILYNGQPWAAAYSAAIK